jgi:predicted TIM-barrel fold metal-dependent hydrolase
MTQSAKEDGNPMSPHPIPRPGAPFAPGPLRKIAIEEQVLDPQLSHTDYTELAAGGGMTPEFWEVAFKRLRDDSARLEEMDASGIEVQVLSLSVPGIESVGGRETARAYARRVNDFLADKARESGGRFQAFAAVPLQDTDTAIVELQRAVAELGMRGVLVRGYTEISDDEQPHYLDEDRFDAFWEALAELGVPLYLCPSPGNLRSHHFYYRDYSELFGPQWAFGPDTAAHALRLIYSGVFDRYPAAQLILGNMGEMIPYFAGRIQRAFEYNPFGARSARRIQDYLAENVYVTTSGNFNSQALITAILTVGADRILFAVGYPYAVSTDGARWIEDAPIAEADRRKIARDNAIRLFGLTDKAPTA